MKSVDLRCGYTWIPLIYKGTENHELSAQQLTAARGSIDKLQVDRLSQRLSDNYKVERLHLNKMFIYSVIYDFKAARPVMVTGVQVVGPSSARVFSRYFVFPEYRSRQASAELLEKSDDFEVLQIEIAATAASYPFLFWSRDKGSRFFERIKVSRPDIFSQWIVHPEKVEILYKDNFQGIFYFNRSPEAAELIVERELRYVSNL
jgi:hypothetical protein